MGGALPGIQRHFADNPHASLLTPFVSGVVGLMFALSSPIIGRALDRYGCRPVYLLSLVAFVILGASGALMPSLPLLIATRALTGIAVAGALNAGLTGIGQLEAGRRGQMLGLHAFVGCIGAVLLFLLNGWLAEMRWWGPFVPHLAGLLILPLAMHLPAGPAMAPPARPLDKRPSPRLGLATMALAALAGMTMFSGPAFAPLHMESIGVTSGSTISMVLSIMALTSLVAAGAYGWTSARLGPAATFALSLAMVGVGLLASGLATSLILLIPGLAVMAAGISMLLPSVSAAAVASAPEAPGSAIGMVMSLVFGAQVLVPVIAGFLDQRHAAGELFLVLGGASIVAGFLCFVHSRGVGPTAIENVGSPGLRE